jgi:hypothetical protein
MYANALRAKVDKSFFSINGLNNGSYIPKTYSRIEATARWKRGILICHHS